jgi:ferredoxin
VRQLQQVRHRGGVPLECIRARPGEQTLYTKAGGIVVTSAGKRFGFLQRTLSPLPLFLRGGERQEVPVDCESKGFNDPYFVGGEAPHPRPSPKGEGEEFHRSSCDIAGLGFESCKPACGAGASPARFLLSCFIVMAFFLLIPATSHAVTQRFPPPDFGPKFVYPHSFEGEPRAGWLAWLDMAALAITLPLAAVIALKWRSRRATVILSLFSVVYFGFYRKGCVCPIGAIQNISQALFDTTFVVPIVVLVFFTLPLLAAVLVGRVFCAGACPLGALQDLVLIKALKVPRWLDRTLGAIPFLYLGLAVLFATIGSTYIICKYDPYVSFFRMAGNFNVWIWSALMVSVALFIGRPYCRYLCPYGALLGMLSRFSFRRVSITPDKCIACGLCRDACAFGVIREGGAKDDEEEGDEA